jgi:hypothetical protein
MFLHDTGVMVHSIKCISATAEFWYLKAAKQGHSIASEQSGRNVLQR